MGCAHVEGVDSVVHVAHEAPRVLHVRWWADGRLVVREWGLLVVKDLDGPVQVHKVVLLTRLQIHWVDSCLELPCDVVLKVEICRFDRRRRHVQSAINFLHARDVRRLELCSPLVALWLLEKPLLVHGIDVNWFVIDHHIDVIVGDSSLLGASHEWVHQLLSLLSSIDVIEADWRITDKLIFVGILAHRIVHNLAFRLSNHLLSCLFRIVEQVLDSLLLFHLSVLFLQHLIGSFVLAQRHLVSLRLLLLPAVIGLFEV